jgi:hypothetical protein
VKGWQHRWFVLSPDNATLEYYEKEEHKNQRPRGALNLAVRIAVCFGWL